ncbi:MAG: hypothetical protein H7174_07270 [Flavobacterium sp.]|nr:hypothetical protein [Flavobacterium sp.]
MAKVITFSRVFPKGHIRQGEQTNFVEKIWKSLYTNTICPDNLNDYINNYMDKLSTEILPYYATISKKHTIRNGNRFKKGNFFSPRVWSNKPYQSKQIIIAPDTEIVQVYDIEIFLNNEIHINGVHFATFGSENCHLIAKNDGLEMKDFISWFSKLPFKGQIICWLDTRYA